MESPAAGSASFGDTPRLRRSQLHGIDWSTERSQVLSGSSCVWEDGVLVGRDVRFCQVRSARATHLDAETDRPGRGPSGAEWAAQHSVTRTRRGPPDLTPTPVPVPKLTAKSQVEFLFISILEMLRPSFKSLSRDVRFCEVHRERCSFASAASGNLYSLSGVSSACVSAL